MTKPPKCSEVIDLSSYRNKKYPVRNVKTTARAANDEKLIETITYHLLMAAKAIEARQR